MAVNKIKKVLIVERSEMGLRALETCIELGFGFVVGFSAADEDSLLVKRALEYSRNIEGGGVAYLGSEPVEESYGNISNIIRTAKIWNCDAIYPGYGPLAEDFMAIKKIEKAKLKFIGPASGVVEIFGNKMKSNELAEKNGFKLLRTFVVDSVEKIAEICLEEKLKYPFIIKHLFSGGGRGNHLVENDQDLVKILSRIDIKTGQYYVQEYVSGKHIEFQFAVDLKKVVSFGTRDCSCQIDFQKFLEECPSGASDKKIKIIEKKIERMLLSVGYRGVGTAEFIYDEKKKEYYFLEINPRIQVEAPVSEKFFGVDIVKMQFQIANNQEIAASKKNSFPAHVIEARIYGRDVFNNFKQDFGKIEKLTLPKMDGIDIFSGYEEGDIAAASYDPLILKIVSSGNSREDATTRLEKALHKLEIEGLSNNKELILWLIATDEFKNNLIRQDFTGRAWKNYLGDNNKKIENFLKRGIFVRCGHETGVSPAKFPNKLRYLKNGTVRDYVKELKIKHQKNPKKCAFNFGIFKDAGAECVFAWWDFTYFGGTLGVDEAIAVNSCFKLAGAKKLPVLMVSNSGGARQQENAFALHAMHFVVAAKKKYNVPLFVNVYLGDNFGGVNASIVEQADIKIAVKNSAIGLAGPKFLSKGGSGDGGDGDGDSARRHYQARNIDLISDNLEKACEQVFSMFALLFNTDGFQNRKNKKKADNSIQIDIDKNKIFRPFGLLEILDSEFGIFEKVALLSDRKGGPEEFPAISGAFATVGEKKVLVLGQHAQFVENSDGYVEKKYRYPGAADFRWFCRKIKLAEKLKIPIILFADTRGADADAKSEYDGISYYISHALSQQIDLKVPIISVNIGLCGSGGGLPFANTADFAIAFENSLKLVSNIEMQSSIILGASDTTSGQQDELLDQLVDATAKFQKKHFFVDKIIPEKNKAETVLLLRKFLITGLGKLSKFDCDELIARRRKRILRVIKTISK